MSLGNQSLPKPWVFSLSYWLFSLSFEFFPPWVFFKMSKVEAWLKCKANKGDIDLRHTQCCGVWGTQTCEQYLSSRLIHSSTRYYTLSDGLSQGLTGLCGLSLCKGVKEQRATKGREGFIGLLVNSLVLRWHIRHGSINN